MKYIYFVALVLVTTQLTSCGGLGPKLPEVTLEKPALIYGYIDMNDAPAYLDYVSFKQYKPYTDKPHGYMRVIELDNDDYIFYREVPSRGSYQLDNFGGKPTFILSNISRYTFSFPSGRNKTAVRTKKSGLYFMGAVKYHELETGFFESSKFELVKVKKSKRDILKEILPHAKGTRWEKMIKRAIRGK